MTVVFLHNISFHVVNGAIMLASKGRIVLHKLIFEQNNDEDEMVF